MELEESKLEERSRYETLRCASECISLNKFVPQNTTIFQENLKWTDGYVKLTAAFGKGN